MNEGEDAGMAFNSSDGRRLGAGDGQLDSQNSGSRRHNHRHRDFYLRLSLHAAL